jgi:hypothetical protein
MRPFSGIFINSMKTRVPVSTLLYEKTPFAVWNPKLTPYNVTFKSPNRNLEDGSVVK